MPTTYKNSHGRYNFRVHKATNQYLKKRKGKQYYLGKVGGPAALRRAEKKWEAILAGNVESATVTPPDEVMLGDAINAFWAYKQRDRRVQPRSLNKYKRILKIIDDALCGEPVPAKDFLPTHYFKVETALMRAYGDITPTPSTLHKDLSSIRATFNWIGRNLTLSTPQYGDALRRPSEGELRAYRHRQRETRGLNMYQPDEIHALLGVASPPLKAAILLGINAGMWEKDCRDLRWAHITGHWVKNIRYKTNVEREAHLWTETLDALKDLGGDVFPEQWRNFLVNDFKDVQIAAGVYREGRAGYALRHTFLTIAEEADYVASKTVMAQAMTDTATAYREKVGRDRLMKISKHVYQWLWGKAYSGG